MATERLNFIDGQWVETQRGETFESINPADPSTTVAHYQDSGADDVQAAISAAAEAKADWASMPAPARGEILRDTAAILDDRADELTDLLTTEEGKTLGEAGGEVGRAIDIFYYYAEKARELGGESRGSSIANRRVYTVKEPVGVASLISPWNYPIAIPAWKIAPALATGTTVVSKPATLAPGVALEIFSALEEAGLPDGVANAVTGSGRRLGDDLVGHDAVGAVSFTGSTQVGMAVYADATDAGKRVQTEMGGKNPTVVSDTADIDDAVEIVAAGAFGVTGQACTACSRAIVYESVYEEFVDAIVDRAEAIEVGPGHEADMGPQVSQSELDGTLEYIETAKEEGGTVAAGGERADGDGYFIEPTVFTDVDPSATLACEEVFGPVLAVISVADFDEAMRVANGVEYGLSSSIVTNDHREAGRFVEEIEAGVAKVNEKTTGLELHVPFGGFKASSSETWREQGDAGIDFYTISKTVYDNF